jgi:DUF4097 and DUF4098 domain-containing protein YvlB
MKKFLEDLKKELELKNMSKKEIDDIIQDHEEMIKQALDDGVSEDDLNSRFGSPKMLADELSFDQDTEPKEKKDVVFTDEKITFKLNDKPITIVIDLVVDDLIIEHSNDQDLHVVCDEEINEKLYEISFDNNELKLIAKKKNESSFFNSSDSHEFKIFIPNNAVIDALTSHMVNGDLEINSLTIQNFKFSGINGNIELENLTTKKTKLNIVNGDIEIDSFQADELVISLVNGEMELNEAKIEHDLIVHTVSGDSEIYHTTCDMLELHTVSGDIEGKELYPNKVKLKSISGDINIKNKEKKEIEIISKSTVSGDIDISA